LSLFFTSSDDFSKSAITGSFQLFGLTCQGHPQMSIFQTKINQSGSVRCHLEKKFFPTKYTSKQFEVLFVVERNQDDITCYH
jgi:hypothetical protein